VAVDTSGKWWVGDQAQDIGEFLQSYATKGYEITEFRLANCGCGSLEFALEADDDEGVARRTCVSCHKAHFICDSGEFWADAEPERWKCLECHSQSTNVGVGFSLYDDDLTGVKWLYVGTRCAKCGVLGCFTGWKVALSNALHYLDEV
jgi:hypothetical protein